MGEGLIECVPNFSEGRDKIIIEKIAESINTVEGVKLLDIDSSEDFNRTVFSFVGEKESVLKAAINCTKTGLNMIDMRKQKGEHARIGAVDVVPFIPISGYSIEDCIELANRYGESVGKEMSIPVFLYAKAAKLKDRISLPNIRKGEYEGLEKKIMLKEWMPDYGPQKFIAKSGAISSGARSVLIAFNVNLSTNDKFLANSIAGKIRTSGIISRNEKGEKIYDKEGKVVRIKGKFSELQAAGWMYDKSTAQVSMNLLDYNFTGMHHVMEEIKLEAINLGLSATAGELVGLVPLNAIVSSGKFYHSNPSKASENELVDAAIEGLMLDKLNIFDPEKRIIEWAAKGG